MEEKEKNSITFGDLLRVIRKNIILMAVIIACSIITGVFYAFKMVAETYESHTSVIVVVNNQGSISIGDDDDIDYVNSLRIIYTVAKLVQEDVILDEVAKDNDTSIPALRGMISCNVEETEYIFQISVVSTDGKYAQKIANEVVASLIKQTKESEAISKLDVTCFQTSVASSPAYFAPNKTLYLIEFIVVGIVLACAVVFIKEFMSNKFKTEDDVIAAFDEDVIGILPDDSNRKKNEKAELVNMKIQEFEPYNKLLSNIRYSDIENPKKVIMVTSTITSELKSTIACNLAYCMRNNKHKVVLIDLDTRKPSDHKVFGVPRIPGLVSYLEGTTSKKDIIKKTEYGVDIITAGKDILNPVVIIESQGLKDLIAELREEYDYIVIDTPPVLACTDALLVSKLCDGVVYNVSINQVRKKEAKMALKSLKSVDANIIGINITKASYSKKDSYYYYYYHQYGEDDKKSKKNKN